MNRPKTLLKSIENGMDEYYTTVKAKSTTTVEKHVKLFIKQKLKEYAMVVFFAAVAVGIIIKGLGG